MSSSRKDEIRKESELYGKDNKRVIGDHWCFESTEEYITDAFEAGAQWADSHRPTCESCKLNKACTVLEYVQRRNMQLTNSQLLMTFGCNHYKRGEGAK